MDTSKHGPATGGAAPAAAAGAQDDGVTRWTVTRLSLIDALSKGWPDLPLAILARSADTVLAQLDSGGASGTREMAGAASLVSLAEALDRRSARADASSLTREGSIRGRAFREAAAMARERATGGQKRPGGPGPVSAVLESGSDGRGALSDAEDGPAEYRLRPLAIKAIRWTGEANCEAVFAFLGMEHPPDEMDHSQIHIPHSAGTRTAVPGDWIVKGLMGEFFPLNPEDFAAAYEPANSAADDGSDLTEDGWPW